MAKHFRVIVFVGANQNKLSYGHRLSPAKTGLAGGYIKISGNGSNALDFHIAFHVGRIAAGTNSLLPHHLERTPV